MVSGEIRDFQISYSSDTNDNTYDQGRLLLPRPGWCASTVDDVKPYFQVLVSKNEPVREKTNNLGSDKVRHKPGCTVTEDG